MNKISICILTTMMFLLVGCVNVANIEPTKGIDSIFKAEIIGNGDIDDLSLNNITSTYFRQEFLDENMTKGAFYRNKNYDPLDSKSEEYLRDVVSPNFRLNLVTNQSQMEEIFCDFGEFDYENEMLIVYLYTSMTSRMQLIQSIDIDEKKLKIKYIDEENEYGRMDTTAPHRRFIVLCMKKFDVEDVEIQI